MRNILYKGHFINNSKISKTVHLPCHNPLPTIRMPSQQLKYRLIPCVPRLDYLFAQQPNVSTPVLPHCPTHQPRNCPISHLSGHLPINLNHTLVPVCSCQCPYMINPDHQFLTTNRTQTPASQPTLRGKRNLPYSIQQNCRASTAAANP